MSEPILTVEGLRVRLPTRAGLVTVVDGVDYELHEREVLGVAGESGSGKTISVLALLGLLPNGAVTEGRALYGGRDLLALSRKRLRQINGREIAMVFQDPYTSLHPMLTIGRQLTEHMCAHLGIDAAEADRRAVDLLAQVRVPDPERSVHAFPHQFSGGMRQRVAIAIALACEPRILVADEPTTALDVTVQAGILRLLDRLRRERGLSIVFITHDLAAMSAIADRIAIYYAGRVVEAGTAAQVFQHPRHPYTHGLLKALPHPEAGHADKLLPIPGAAPVPQQIPPGCALHPRCAYAEDRCRVEIPALLEFVEEERERALACHVDPFRDPPETVADPALAQNADEL